MGDFEQMLNDLCKMSKAQLVQMVRNTDEVEIALNIRRCTGGGHCADA